MAKPILMTVDDEPHVLNAIARDLLAHYQEDYRIVKVGSGTEALEAVQEFKRRGTPVALFLVDQRMPAMSGIEFLTEAIKLYPESKRVLLTAYADTDAAIASINEIDLDYYLMKPWDPPEERLYPVLEDPYRVVTLGDGSELRSHALLVATGVKVRELDVPGIEPFVGGSVYYGAATSEAVHYQGRRVFVIGGANSAGQGALFLSRFASHVTIVIRAGSLKTSMSQYLIDQIERTENISLTVDTEVAAVGGTGHLESITLKDGTSGEYATVPADAIFVFIGAVPHTDIVAGIVERTEAGFIPTGPDLIRDGRRPRNWKLPRDPFLLETGVPGIFAAGDVRLGVVRRVASAVGEGAVSVSFVHKYLETV